MLGSALPETSRAQAMTPGGRAGFDQRGRPLHRRAQPHDAAAGMHHLDLAGDADRGQPGRQRAGVVAHDRADIGVHHHGRGALVFADLRQDLRAPADIDAVAELGAQDGLGLDLVLRIGVGVQEADRHRLDALLAEAPCAAAITSSRDERHAHRAVGAEPLVDLEPQASRRQRLRLVVLQVVEHGDAQAAHLEHVAEAGSRQEPGAGALVFEDGVGRDRRRMDDAGDAVGRGLVVLDQRLQRLGDAAAVVVRRRGHLAGLDQPVVARDHDIGEGAADVDADPVAMLRHGCLPGFLEPPRRHGPARACAARRGLSARRR
jgi:hypothetical protein